MNRRQHGVSLVELMVAMTIGLLILAAIFSVYLSSRDSFRTSDLVARMQENARIALQIVAEDLQATGYLGNTANPALIEGRRGGPGERPDIGSDCAERWYVDMAAMLVIGNNQVPTLNGTSFAERCMNGSNYLAGTDVIALKRASSAPFTSMAPHNNWLLIRTDPMRGAFFIGGGSEPSGFDPDISTTRRWLVHVFYVARDNHDGRIPVLRRKVLGAGPALHDGQSDLVRGIEDLQIQLGIDTNGDGTVDSYVEPGTEGFARIVSARVWVLARADEPEADHDDSKNTYVYADKSYTPDTTSDGLVPAPHRYRRLLLSRTVTFRNKWQ